MTAICAIVVFALSGSIGPTHSDVIRPMKPISLATGDTLGMALMESMACSAQSAQPTQPAQTRQWWDMPSSLTVVARSKPR